jgi:hypothetical protein
MIAKGMDPQLAKTLAGRACEVGTVRAGRAGKRTAVRAKRRVGKTAKGMSAALREANKKARKANGEFRKGYDQKRVMQMAHKIRRSMQ